MTGEAEATEAPERTWLEGVNQRAERYAFVVSAFEDEGVDEDGSPNLGPRLWMTRVFLDETEAHSFADQMNAFYLAADTAYSAACDSGVEAEIRRVSNLIDDADGGCWSGYCGPAFTYRVEYVALATRAVVPLTPPELLNPA